MSVTWEQALTISGKPAGLYFHCSTCGWEIRHSAPSIVRHCNRDEHAPTRTDNLPVRKLTAPGKTSWPDQCIPCFWDDNEQSEEYVPDTIPWT